MTKDQEMAVIDRAAAELGRDSYLGPWLVSIRAELAGAIRSDLFPTPMLPAEAYKHAEAVRDIAKGEAEALIEAADKQAAKILDKAQKDAAAVTGYTAEHLRQAYKRLTGQTW